MRAITPHRRVRWLAYTSVTSAVVLCFALAEWWAAKYVSDRSRVASTVLEIVIVLLAALAFTPFHRQVEKLIDEAFTKRRRQALDALAGFRRELGSFKDLGQLSRRVIEAIEHHTDTAACAIYLRRDVYRVEGSSFDRPAQDVDLDDPLAIRLRSTAAPAPPQSLHSTACGTLAFPLTAAGDLIGFVCVEGKFGKFESDEVHALAMLTEALAPALTQLDPQLRVSEIAVANNLPADATPLIGRGDEINDLKHLLTQSRLVTLTGAGGVGKTRLALHVAAEMRSNPDGIWFIDLAPLDNPALVPSALAGVLAVADEGGSQTLIDRVASYLRQRQALIVLDNCEHLIVAAAAAAEHLLARCPRIQIIATSREPLGVAAEEPYRVPSLPVPNANEAVSEEQAMTFPSIALFVARARHANRAFALTSQNVDAVVDIVRRLDGIPMAIELAVPRLKVLSLEQLRTRLDERFALLTGGSRTAIPRHQTLRALIGWSFDLLREPEKRLLRRCAVFRGDWSFEAAEALTEEDRIDDWAVLDLLEALVDKSLVIVEDRGESRRYRIPESTRQFAHERLKESGEEDAVRLRYARYFARRAQDAGAVYWESDSDAWIASVRDDLENYRGAIAAAAAQEFAASATIVAQLRWFWYTTARREGSELVESVSARCAQGGERSRPALLALCAALLDTSAKAIAPATEAAALLDNTDRYAAVEAQALEAIALGRAGRLAEACAQLERALDAARSTGEPRLVGWVLSMVAYWRGVCGDGDRARELFDEADLTLRACGDAWQVARLHVHRAEFLFTQSHLDDALASVRKAEDVFRRRHASTGLCISLLNATAYLLALGCHRDAWTTAREGLQLARELDNPMALAWAVGHLAELAAEAGDTTRCARLLGHADSAYARSGSAREPTEQRGYDRAMHLVHSELDEKTIVDLMADGARASPDAIASDALEVAEPRVKENVLY